MPLRKHFILRERGRHYINDLAWYRLRKHALDRLLPVTPIPIGTAEYMNDKQLYADARMARPRGAAFRPALLPSWRREIQIIASALYDSGYPVDLRVFRSRKHARPSRSKLHAVRSA